MALPLSLSVPCSGLNLNPSTTHLRTAASSSPKTLTLVPTAQNGTNGRNRVLSLQARRSQSDYSSTASRPKEDGFVTTAIGGQSEKVYVKYAIYKGKAAVTFSARAPEFSPVESGTYKVSRDGYVFLQFCPAMGDRQYDWLRKQIFTLSAEEIGTLISLGPKDSWDFFHDPNLGKNGEGQVRKILKIAPLPDGSGHSFNLSVSDKIKNVDENIFVPVTKGEFAVVRSCLNYLLPHLLGWSTFASSIGPGRANDVNSRTDLEWDR